MTPLRILRDELREVLMQIYSSASEQFSHVDPAKALLAMAAGKNYTEATHAAWWCAGDTVLQLGLCFTGRVWRRMHHRAAAVRSRSTGAPRVSGFFERFTACPDHERDGTATWSATTLQRALR